MPIWNFGGAGRCSLNEQEVLEFRTKILKHIADNFDQYEERLATAVTNDILSNEEMKEKIEDEMYEMDEEKKTELMKAKCKEHLEKMQNNENEWGGVESIAAFSDVFETNALLFSNSNGLDLAQYNENYRKIAHILFSGLSHYDGLLWIESDCVDIIAEVLAERLANSTATEAGHLGSNAIKDFLTRKTR